MAPSRRSNAESAQVEWVRIRTNGMSTFPDLTPLDRETLDLVRPFTMPSNERVAALCSAVRYLHRYGIEGDVVECGVWAGGSMLAAARTLVAEADTQRHLYLFDTYTGMTAPTEHDVSFAGEHAAAILSRMDPADPRLYSPLEVAQQVMGLSGYPGDRIHFVKGKVEDTVPDAAPEKIALLRLDTDWYESTRHELEHLFPRLVPGGVLIIDDYGHWQGARKAVDEYFAAHPEPIFLQRIDYTGRIAIRQGPRLS